jgi:diguanylate cyclase (GGDEF)-like protein/PAS domain S-box-containing protein
MRADEHGAQALAPAAVATPLLLAGSASLQAFTASVPEAFAVLDRDGFVLVANQRLAEMLGRGLAEIAGQHATTFVPPELRCQHELMLRRCLARGPGCAREAIQVPGVHANGALLSLEVALGTLEDHPRRLFTCLVRDVTWRRETERLLRETEERYALALKGAQDGLWDWDLRTGALIVSPAWCTMIGLAWTPAPIPCSAWFDRVVAEDRPGLQADIEAHLAGRTARLRSEHRVRRGDGFGWLRARGLSACGADGAPIRLAGWLSDLTAQRSAREALRHEARHDPLCRLPNRILFTELLRDAAGRARREALPCSLLYLDLDGFKAVNDRHGHAVGDELLVEVARRLERSLGSRDAAARLGGDEFAVLADGDLGMAIDLAVRIEEALAHPVDVGSATLGISASIGIAGWRPSHARPEDLMRDADAALYRAKAVGRACHVVFGADDGAAEAGAEEVAKTIRG